MHANSAFHQGQQFKIHVTQTLLQCSMYSRRPHVLQAFGCFRPV